jgi:uncharacterized protein
MENENKQSNNRREFIKKGIFGAAGLTLLPSLQEKTVSRMDDKKGSDFIYRTLGRTNIRVPIVSMGTSANEYVIRAALNRGVVHFDTGNTYGNGLDEATFGRALKGKPRDSFVMATKIVGLRENGSGMPLKNVTPEEFKADFRKKVESSLKRLQLDYVDILYLHSADDPNIVKLEMIKDLLQEYKQAGKAKYIGVSTHVTQVVYPLVEEKIFDVVLLPYNFRDQDETIKKAINHAVKNGCGIVAMKTLAGVYWDSERKQPINAKAALKWVLQNEDVHTAIMTINTFEQLETYLSLMGDLKLTPDEKKDLKLGDITKSTGMYCSHCEKCKTQCPYGLDIPKMMRSYMYAYGYQKPSLAKETLRQIENMNIRCNDCSSCSVNCSMGFEVKEKILDISRIMNIPDEFLA